MEAYQQPILVFGQYAPNGKKVSRPEEKVLKEFPDFIQYIGCSKDAREKWVADQRKDKDKSLTVEIMRQMFSGWVQSTNLQTKQTLEESIKPKIEKLESEVAYLKKKVKDLTEEIRIDKKAERELMMENCSMPDTEDQAALTKHAGTVIRAVPGCEQFHDIDIEFVKILKSDNFVRHAVSLTSNHLRNHVARRAKVAGNDKYLYASKSKADRTESRRIWFGNQWCQAKNIFHKGAKFFKMEKLKGKPKKNVVTYQGNDPKAADIAAKHKSKTLEQPKLIFTEDVLKGQDKLPMHLFDQLTLKNHTPKKEKKMEVDEEEEEEED